MIDFPTFPEPKLETLTDQEIESTTEKVALLIGALNDVKQNIIKENMGEELYQKAILQLSMLLGMDGEPEPSVDDLLKLDEIDRRKNADFAELIISIDRSDDNYIEILRTLANRLFGSESLDDITDDPEKLALFGLELKKLFNQGHTPTSKELDKLTEESTWIDIKIADALRKHIRHDIERASVDVRGTEMEFDFYIDDIPQDKVDEILGNKNLSYDQRRIELSKLSYSVFIKIEDGTLFLNHEAVKSRTQLEDIMKSLEQLPNIIEGLESEIS